MTYASDTYVIVTHPFLYDRHVLARVVSTTKAMVTLRYITPRGEREDSERRKLDAIVGPVDPKRPVSEVLDALRLANDAMQLMEKLAKTTYMSVVNSLIVSV